MKKEITNEPTRESSTDTIDISRFEELSDGDRNGLLELIQLYLVKTAEQIAELDKALIAGESAHVARIAHSMVGASAMVGMDTLLPTLRTLEAQGEKKDMAEARHTFDEVGREFNRIHAQLKKTADHLAESSM